MKLVSRRGPYWPDAYTTAAIVTENTVPATVIIEPPIDDSTCRAPSGREA